MRMAACLIIAGIFFGQTGCSLFKKKDSSSRGGFTLFPRADKSSTRSEEFRPTDKTEPRNPVVPTSASSGILAGQVIDGFSRPVADAYILVSVAKTQGGAEKKPVDVPANAQGYFTITGLRPGQHYQLIARARDGKRMLAGTTWAMPPNPRVLIKASEDFVTKNTPPIPPPPSWPEKKEEKTAANSGEKKDKTTASGDSTWNPRGLGDNITKTDARDTDQWSPKTAPSIKVPVDDDSVDTSRIAKGKSDRDVVGTPLIIGPRKRPATQLPPAPVKEKDPWISVNPSPATKIPSCVLAGKQLVNFALYDLDNKPWEFRQRKGRVVLLDFWSTTCMPCRKAIPHLKILQAKYRKAGLEIIGIAYEAPDRLENQRRQVDLVCQNMRINYKVLMGASNCPVSRQFGIRGLPTLVLVDENGWIIDKHVGLLTQDGWQDLDAKIQRWLGVRK